MARTTLAAMLKVIWATVVIYVIVGAGLFRVPTLLQVKQTMCLRQRTESRNEKAGGNGTLPAVTARDSFCPEGKRLREDSEPVGGNDRAA